MSIVRESIFKGPTKKEIEDLIKDFNFQGVYNDCDANPSKYYDVDILEMIFNHVVENSSQEKLLSTSLLIEAARDGELEVVKYLVEEHNANVNEAQVLPLRIAAKNDHADIFIYLAENGAKTQTVTYGIMNNTNSHRIINYIRENFPERIGLK